MSLALDPVDHAPRPAETARPPDPLPLLLLRDELAVDAAITTPQAALATMPRLVGLVLAGFGAQALCTGLLHIAFQDAALPTGLGLAGEWSVALAGGFFLAICAGLPGYWFHTVVVGITPPAWRVALELVRVQAVGSVVLSAVLPLWVAACLGLWMIGGHLPTGVLLAGNVLPMLCAVPGMLGLRRAFTRMAQVKGVRFPEASASFLTFWWCGAFLCTAPLTVYRLLAWL